MFKSVFPKLCSAANKTRILYLYIVSEVSIRGKADDAQAEVSEQEKAYRHVKSHINIRKLLKAFVSQKINLNSKRLVETTIGTSSLSLIQT